MLNNLFPSDPGFVGSWEIVGRLGSGGMGVVYLGVKGSRRVAVKVVRSSFVDDVSLKSRVIREIDVLRKIKSLNVASIVEADVSSDFAWFASEFVDGPNLKQFVEVSGPLNFSQWLFLAEGLFEAFDAIHKQNVIHRDVKPSNILIGPDGPKVIDFGIALTDEATSLTTTGLVAGSPAWLSPEQINDRVVTKASDLFSLGSVLTYAATGNSPWNKENTTKTAVIFHRILTEKPNLDILNDFQKNFISKLLSKNPQDRPSAKEAKALISKEIARLKNQPGSNIENEKIDITSTEIFKPTYKQPKKYVNGKLIFIGIAASALVVVSVFGINLFNSPELSQPITVAKDLPETLQTTTPTQTPSPEQTSEEFASTETITPTPSPTKEQPTPTPTKEETNETSKKFFVEVGGEKIDLGKTRICFTIFQHDTNDNYCFKESPTLKDPLYYVDSQFIGGYSRPLSDLVTLNVPFKKSNIMSCFNKSWSGTFEYYTTGISEQIMVDIGTSTIVHSDSDISSFCKKYGDWQYGVKELSIPPYEVVVFNKNAKLPQDFTRVLNTGSKKYSYVWTWSKIK